jgi:hypothetical protein
MTKRRLVICLAIAIAILLVMGLGANCIALFGSGTITIEATLNGQPWPTTGTESLNYKLTLALSPIPQYGIRVPVSMQEAVGDYTCTYISGGPGGVPSISASPSSHLDPGGQITFTLAF